VTLLARIYLHLLENNDQIQTFEVCILNSVILMNMENRMRKTSKVSPIGDINILQEKRGYFPGDYHFTSYYDNNPNISSPA